MEREVMNKMAEEFKISRVSINKFWTGLKAHINEGKLFNANRKYLGYQPHLSIDLEKVRSIPLSKRSTLTKLATHMNLHISTVTRLVKKGSIRRHSNAIKPALTDANKIARVKWCLGKIVKSTLNDGLLFEPMYNVVHIDEKWFLMTKTAQNYYLLPDEIEPHRTYKSKRFITKIMFMAAVARPVFSSNGSLLFDGKIGIFHFTYEQAARRQSKNRPKGTMEVKPIESITKVVIKQCLIEKVIPVIKAKWPEGASKTIYIQQDNATPHIAGNDTDFLHVAQADGFDIRVVCQPSNSPDLNVLDLGFFRSIQSLQDEKSPNNISELLDAVTSAYEEVEPQKLKHVWLSLKYCMNEILRVKGNNNYKLPHVGKQRLERLGLLPDPSDPNGTVRG
ncbi:hypothetical protein RND81_05G009400 [Saponaria officinalis]|uniref:Transposase n=1 Tax=Saponaria officinalis TaxID=3572 RepID=A0AAW1KRU1_SAPOF